MELSIQPERTFPAAQIEQFLKSRPEASFFHTRKYRELLANHLGAVDESICVSSGQEIVAFFPVLSKTSNLGLKVYNSSPYYGSHGGIVGDRDYVRPISSWFESLTSADNVLSATVIDNLFSESESWFGQPLDDRIGQYTELHVGDLLENFHYKTRNAIRKGQKGDFRINRSAEGLEKIWEIHNENMVAIGGKPKTKDFFLSIPEFFDYDTDYDLWFASRENEVVAGLLLFKWNNSIEYFTPVLREAFRETQVLSALIFEAMSFYGKNGFKLWNWGGTWKSQEGVYRFKNRFAANDKVYRYNIKLNTKVLGFTPNELLSLYPGFYVVPFNMVRNNA